MIAGVLFDFAGTLFVPRGPADWVAAAARELGVALPDADRTRLAEEFAQAGIPGGPYPAAIPSDLRAAYARRDLDEAEHRAAYVGLLATVDAPAPGFAEALYDRVRRADAWIPYADARPVVDALQQRGVAVGLVSNVGFDIRPILRAHGFAMLAEHATLSFEHGAAKPDPALFRAAIERLGTRPEETLVVGDHPEADGGGAALGCTTLILPMSPPGAAHGLDAVLRLI